MARGTSPKRSPRKILNINKKISVPKADIEFGYHMGDKEMLLRVNDWQFGTISGAVLTKEQATRIRDMLDMYISKM